MNEDNNKGLRDEEKAEMIWDKALDLQKKYAPQKDWNSFTTEEQDIWCRFALSELQSDTTIVPVSAIKDYADRMANGLKSALLKCEAVTLDNEKALDALIYDHIPTEMVLELQSRTFPLQDIEQKLEDISVLIFNEDHVNASHAVQDLINLFAAPKLHNEGTPESKIAAANQDSYSLDEGETREETAVDVEKMPKYIFGELTYYRCRHVDVLMSELTAENERLKQWKESAMSLTPPMQEIAKELNVPLGQSIHDKILPGIKSLKSQLQSKDSVDPVELPTPEEVRAQVMEWLRVDYKADRRTWKNHGEVFEKYYRECLLPALLTLFKQSKEEPRNK